MLGAPFVTAGPAHFGGDGNARGTLLGQTERQFNRLMLAGLIAGFLLLIAAFLLVVMGLRYSAQSAALVQHTYEVKDSLADLKISLERSESARRGYLLVPSDYRVTVFNSSSQEILPTLNRIEALMSDNPQQAERVQQLRPLVLEELAELERSMDLATTGNLAAARAGFADTDSLAALRTIRARASTISAAEERLLSERQTQLARSQQSLQWLLLLAGIMLAGVATFTFWLVRRYTSALLASQSRLNELNAGLEAAVAERTTDLRRANDEIQRFAYIVSHDLRSPLVNVMGFTAEMERVDQILIDFLDRAEAEEPGLVSDEVRLAAREDLPEAIGFIRSSTQKMDRLINAILALSRQGRRVLTPDFLPMEQIIGDIANSLAVQAGDRGATITVETPMPDIRHDRLAIEQIFSNLMENATKYLAIGRPGEIFVRGARKGGRAIFEVEDNGRGIAPEDHERVFELFRRSGPQDQSGEGIGLANVRALAYRLGGTVTVRSTLGEGATFVVDLPIEFSGEGKDR
jgi:signal transduction histidine kinase